MDTAQIFRVIASSYGRMLTSVVTAILLTPLVLDRLGKEAFGLWALTLTIGGYFGLAETGVTSAATRYVSHYRALRDWPNLNKMIGSTMVYYVGLATLSLLLSGLAALFAPHIFKISAGQIGTLRLLLLNLGLISLNGFIGILPIMCVVAAQRQNVLNMWMLGIQILIAILTAVGLLLGAGVLLLAVLQLLSGILLNIVAFILSRRYLPEAHFRPRWDKEQGRLLVSFASLALLITMGTRVIYYTDTLVIGAFISMAAVAGYSVILKITEYTRGMVLAGVGVLGTFVVEQAALQNTSALARMWREGTKWALVISLPICALLALLGRELITAWVGSDFAIAAVPLTWLAVGQVFDLSQSAGQLILMNAGHHKTLAVLTIVEAVLNLALSIFLVRILGVVGVAIGTTIPLLLRSLVFYPIYMPRVTDLKLTQYLREGVLPAVLTALPAVLLAVFYRFGDWHRTEGWHHGAGSLALLALSEAVVTVVMAVFFCLSAAQRNHIKYLVARRFKRTTIDATA